MESCQLQVSHIIGLDIHWSSHTLTSVAIARPGTTHRFIHEIKPMVSYDIEISFGGWGEKWVSRHHTRGEISIAKTHTLPRQMYCVGLFVTRPTHPKSLASTANGPKSGTISGASTPLTRKLATTRADGSIVHAVSVSTFCFKLGRLSECITCRQPGDCPRTACAHLESSIPLTLAAVPPAVALSMCGYGPTSSSARTHRLHALGPRAVVKYLKGGWKEDPEAVASVESYEQMGERMGDRGDLMRQALEAFGVEASD